MSKQVEAVKASLGLIGGRHSDLLDIAPSLANYLMTSTKSAANVAVATRESEANLAKELQRNEVPLRRLEDGTANDLFGPTRTNPCLDALVSVRQNREALKRAVNTVEADLRNALEQPDVRAELAEYANQIADTQEAVVMQQEVAHEAAKQLKKALTLSATLKQEVSTAQLGNLINTKTGEFSDAPTFIARHRGIARVISSEVGASA